MESGIVPRGLMGSGGSPQTDCGDSSTPGTEIEPIKISDYGKEATPSKTTFFAVPGGVGFSSITLDSRGVRLQINPWAILLHPLCPPKAITGSESHQDRRKSHSNTRCRQGNPDMGGRGAGRLGEGPGIGMMS